MDGRLGFPGCAGSLAYSALLGGDTQRFLSERSRHGPLQALSFVSRVDIRLSVLLRVARAFTKHECFSLVGPLGKGLPPSS